MRRRTYITGLIVLVLTAAVSWWTTEEEAVSEPLLTTPEVGPFQVEVTTTGELQAKNSVQIKGPSAARRVRIYEIEIARLVDEGTEVKPGDFVAELDRTPLEDKTEDVRLDLQKSESKVEQARIDTALALSQARDDIVDLRFSMEEAELNKEQSQYEAPSVQRRAQIDYERAVRDYEKAQDNYATKVRRAEATMREVEAELAEDRRRMNQLDALRSKFTIEAPAAGMVVYHRNWRGDKVTEGSSIRFHDPVVATLPDLSVMESVTFVNEVDVQKLKTGQPVTLGLDADPEKTLTGTVTNIANIGQQRPNSDAKVFEVVVEIAETDTTLRPAMTTSNAILVAKEEKALHVPLETLHSRGDTLTYVFMKENVDIVRQEVAVGQMNENRAIVERGLSPDDEIFLSVPPDTANLAFRSLKPQPPGDAPKPLPSTPAATVTAVDVP